MNADGTALKRLTNDPGKDAGPAWSPDGTKIAFSSDRDGRFQIYVMNADGTGVKRLTSDAGDSGFPAWSPDGTRIAFASGRNGNADLYVMLADGTGQKRLTSDPNDDLAPSWSPDGRKIAFDRDRGGVDFDLLVVGADGTGETPLTKGPAGEVAGRHEPRVRPRGRRQRRHPRDERGWHLTDQTHQRPGRRHRARLVGERQLVLRPGTTIRQWQMPAPWSVNDPSLGRKCHS